MTGNVRIYIQAFKLAFARRMAYRGDFLFSCVLTLLYESVIPLVTVLIYGSGYSFPGWGFYEVLAIQSAFMLARGLAYPTLFGMVITTIELVKNGQFDLLLLKPRSILFITIATGIETEDLSTLLGGAVLFTIAVCNLPPAGLLNALLFIPLLLCSVAFLFSFALLMAGSSFKWVGNYRLYEIFSTVTQFASYPLSIFPSPMRAAFSFVVPIAVIAFIPASVLLGHSIEFLLLSIGTSLLFPVLGLLYWHKMLRNYTSAGG
ncbi:MAG: ABC-2 family transporter protein [Spirochaetales bacterium]|nr:ABC-2 family transporter protein [Spirochaetales bacterium]